MYVSDNHSKHRKSYVSKTICHCLVLSRVQLGTLSMPPQLQQDSNPETQINDNVSASNSMSNKVQLLLHLDMVQLKQTTEVYRTTNNLQPFLSHYLTLETRAS